jgi:DNA (cytosine-5)-methyltransferase 1
MTLTVGSLFSGIGGLDLGLERAGMKVIWQSEIDPYACRVLSKHWPEVPNHGDIKAINWGNVVQPDVICGGYPCQPFSTAGKRRGEEDPRHLWPWVRTAISELRPRYAILENVRGHLSMGGLTVIGELASIGYDAEWRIVSAASVGANHRRDRVIIVAYPNSAPRQQQQKRQIQEFNFRGCSAGQRNMAYTNIIGLQTARPEQQAAVFARSNCNRNGFLGEGPWKAEPDVGRVANGIPNRVDRLRGLGNAVVPQVAEVIGRLVISHAQHN